MAVSSRRHLRISSLSATPEDQTGDLSPFEHIPEKRRRVLGEPDGFPAGQGIELCFSGAAAANSFRQRPAVME